MTQREIICPHCKQINRRGTDFVGRLLDPRLPQLCTLCGTNLRTGMRDAGGVALGAIGWVATYFLNAFVCAGGFFLLFMGVLLAWPEFFETNPGWDRVLGIGLMMAGVLVGLIIAEKARRHGELHLKHRRK
jgi:hypothetical protein